MLQVSWWWNPVQDWNYPNYFFIYIYKAVLWTFQITGIHVRVKDYQKHLVLPAFSYKIQGTGKSKYKARVFVTYFEGNEVSSSSCEDPKTAVDGWGARQSRRYTPKKCWNIWTSWWRHFSQTLWVSQCKRHGPNVYFSLNTLQPFHTGIVLITSYSLSSMTNICHVVFVHSLSAHGWRSLLHWYVHCFGKVFILFHT